MNSFDHTNAYLVVFPPGGSGSFILSLLGKFYYGSDLVISETGHAHKKSFDYNWNKKQTQTYVLMVTNLVVSAFKHIDPENANLPVFYADHNLTEQNLDFFFQKFPKGKVIVVTTVREDILRVRICAFVKAFLFRYNLKLFNVNYEAFLQKHVEYQNKDPNSFTKEDFLNIFKLLGEPNQYFEEFKTEKQIYFLPYSKIINDMDFTLQLLSTVMEKPITDSIKEEYKRYLKQQEIMLNKHTPWLLNPQLES